VPYIRLIALVAAVVIAVCVLLYVVTGRPAWRRLAWQVFSFAAIAVGVVSLLLLLEHLLGSG
jgi:cytochrome bd-type quinol oxidase subunit 1